jgi:hypothetical protein
MLSRALRVTLVAALSIAALAYIFAKAMDWEIHQDEHQFIAPGVLWAEHGLLPYRDFPLFHMPNLVFVYGALDKVFSYKALPARVLCAVCMWFSVLLVGWLSHRACTRFSDAARLGISIGAALLFCSAAVFANVARLAWNHALPVFLVLCAFAIFVKTAERVRARAWLLMSGFCVGFAIGTRLTFAPLLAPFGLMIFFFPNFAWREKWISAAMFSIGAIVSLLPSLYFFAAYPEQFWFGNLSYPKLSVVWREHQFDSSDAAKYFDSEHGYLDPHQVGKRGRALKEKLIPFANETLKLNTPIFIAFALIGVPTCVAALARRTWCRSGSVRESGRAAADLMQSKPEATRPASQDRAASTPENQTGSLTFVPRFDLFLLALLFPFLLAGCIAPSRYHTQYFYALLPFLPLWVSYGLGALDPAQTLTKAALALFALCCVAAVPMASFAAVQQIDSKQKWSPAMIPRQFAADAKLLGAPHLWDPVRAHETGLELRRLVGADAGKVLTLAPVFPLEGGLDIYPQFVTGAFAWRSSHLVPAEKRKRVGLISPYDLDALLANDPPRAILLRDKDERLNKPLIAYATAHNFKPQKIRDKTLWLAPTAATGL